MSPKKRSDNYIQLKRAYQPPAEEEGRRVLVDRFWPRGVSKKEAHIDLWMKSLAPSDDLRKWFGHRPEKWREFKQRYFEELDKMPAEIGELLNEARRGMVTLVFAARDETHNNAVALKEYLERRL
ncbi:MAG: DUF488 family protein [Verrucomicrobia bacterium]|jgi:uncharacterized protein YeaO (DUF488 family)|nr:DUF488 family protein [Verrucomicrobiota bacterium]